MNVPIGDFFLDNQMWSHIYDLLFPTDKAKEHFEKTGEVSQQSVRLSHGPKSRELEQTFAQVHGCKYGVLSNSGTSSLHTALQSLKEIHGWEDGDEVIVPATTFVATVNIVLQNNLKPVFVDIEKNTYNIASFKIREAITSKTKCIIPVHLFGLPADMDSISEIAEEYQLKIIEDACESALSKYYSRALNRLTSVGTQCDIACFSFYISHTITAGIGGIAITNNINYQKKMKSLVNHGWDRETRPVDNKGFDFDEIKKRYYFSSIGHSFRITEFEASLALSQLANRDAIIKKRSYIVKKYNEGLAHLQERGILKLPYLDFGSVYMMYPLQYYGNGGKWELIKELEKKGIETREMLPLINQPIYKDMINAEDYPVSKDIINNGFYIGCHHYLTDEQISYVINTISEILRTKG